MPGDDETRAFRRRLHDMFDPLWKSGLGPFTINAQDQGGKQMRRNRAYRWLAKTMGIDPDKAHFGMFTLEQCQRAEAAIKELVKTKVGL